MQEACRTSQFDGCPRLASGHGCWPRRGQVDLRMRSGCLLHPKLGTTSVCPPRVSECARRSENSFTRESWNQLHFGISWPKKHSSRAGRVGQFLSFQTPGHRQLPLALPARPSHGRLLCHLLQEPSCQRGVLGAFGAIGGPDLQAHFLVGPSPLGVQLAMVAE